MFWSDFDAGSLHALPVGGGASRELLSPGTAPNVYGLAVRAGRVYTCASSLGEIRTVPSVGGPSSVLATDDCYDPITVIAVQSEIPVRLSPAR